MRSLKLSKKLSAKNFSPRGTERRPWGAADPPLPPLSLSPHSPLLLSLIPFRPPSLSVSPPLSRATRIVERTLARLLAHGLACAGKSIPYRSVATTSTTLLLSSTPSHPPRPRLPHPFTGRGRVPAHARSPIRWYDDADRNCAVVAVVADVGVGVGLRRRPSAPRFPCLTH